MAAKSEIEWTDATWNPVTGCTKVSPGCAHCYAEAITLRFGRGGPFLPGKATIRLHPDRLLLPLFWKKPRRIFVNSMSDLFHEEIPLDFIYQVFQVMAHARRHTFQILTKRHERLQALSSHLMWPPNVWIGVSVENQYWADRRIPALLDTAASVRFLSVEPLLKPVDLCPYLGSIQWVIVGGESGPRARPMHPDWVRRIREDCVATGVPFFFKQWGGITSKAGGRTLDCRTWDEMPQHGLARGRADSARESQLHLPSNAELVTSRAIPPWPSVKTGIDYTYGLFHDNDGDSMQKLDTIWPIEPHTSAKHDILTYYLKAWFPIQSRVPKRLLYIDGFAGPGEYREGEDGSPILALRVVMEHILLPRLTRPGMELVFVFIEERPDRFDNLQRKLETIKLPPNVRIIPVRATFEQAIGQQLAQLEEQGKRLAPSLVFIDPFGPTGFPMDLVEQISRQPRAEVLINFSYQPLNQWFLGDPSKHQRLNELFGDDRWRPALEMSDPRQKEDFLVEQYRLALSERGWRGTRFRMVNRHNQTQYYLLFGTKHFLGMLAMKQAMWSVAPEGDFQYSDLSNPYQARLFSKLSDEEYANELAEQIFQRRHGATVTKEALIQDELARHPTCIERHLTRALTILEYESSPSRIVGVQKKDDSKRRAKSYPEGCLITFS